MSVLMLSNFKSIFASLSLNLLILNIFNLFVSTFVFCILTGASPNTPSIENPLYTPLHIPFHTSSLRILYSANKLPSDTSSKPTGSIPFDLSFINNCVNSTPSTGFPLCITDTFSVLLYFTKCCVNS